MRAVGIALLVSCSRVAPAQTMVPSPTATATTTATATDAAPRSRLVVHIVPLGAIDDDMVREAAEGLGAHVPAVVVVEPRAPLIASMASTIKGRYRAERILDWMEGIAGDEGKWMSVAEVDIVAKKGQNENWGVLGLGNMDGRCSVLSTFRMRRRWENGGASDDVVRDRLWKTAVHELGHTLGLPHCPNVGCIMEDAHGTVKTTDREVALCPDCARRFREAAGL